MNTDNSVIVTGLNIFSGPWYKLNVQRYTSANEVLVTVSKGKNTLETRFDLDPSKEITITFTLCNDSTRVGNKLARLLESNSRNSVRTTAKGIEKTYGKGGVKLLEFVMIQYFGLIVQNVINERK